MTWVHGARARLRLLARRAAESRIDQIRFHIDMETQRLVQPGRRLEGRGLWAAIGTRTLFHMEGGKGGHQQGDPVPVPAGSAADATASRDFTSTGATGGAFTLTVAASAATDSLVSNCSAWSVEVA